MKFERTHTQPFPAAIVFSAWASKDAVVPPVTAIDIDPCVGGVFRLRVGSEATRLVMDGRILEFEPTLHIRYTWDWGGDDPGCR